MTKLLKEMYPYEYCDLPSHYIMDPQVKGFVEGYAMALSHVMKSLSGDSPCAKHYDPLLVESGVIHSYAFDMKDGGRHHPVSDYKDVGEVMQVLLKEAIDWVRDD